MAFVVADRALINVVWHPFNLVTRLIFCCCSLSFYLMSYSLLRANMCDFCHVTSINV